MLVGDAVLIQFECWLITKTFESEKGHLSYLQCFHARNVTRIFLGGGHLSLTFLSVDFPAELV